jgi:hypothetical protein
MTEKKTESGSSQEYWRDVRDYAASAVSGEDWSKDADLSDRVHELVDGSEWVIYYWRNLKVLEHTEHFDAYESEGGLHGDKSETSLRTILTGGAYYAMVADVSRMIEAGKSAGGNV